MLRHPGGGQRHLETYTVLLGNVDDCPLRHLPTAGACEQRLRVNLYFSSCEQPLGTYSRLLPTAGVWDQHINVSLRLLPTARVCNQHIGVSPRLLLTAGVCH